MSYEALWYQRAPQKVHRNKPTRYCDVKDLTRILTLKHTRIAHIQESTAGKQTKTKKKTNLEFVFPSEFSRKAFHADQKTTWDLLITKLRHIVGFWVKWLFFQNTHVRDIKQPWLLDVSI